MGDHQNTFLKTLQSFQKSVQDTGPAASGSYSLIGSILIFTLAGWYIDQNFGSSPKGTLVGAGCGVVIGFYLLIKTIKEKRL